MQWAEADDELSLATQLRASAERGRIRFDYDLSPFSLKQAETAIEAFYGKVRARQRVNR